MLSMSASGPRQLHARIRDSAAANRTEGKLALGKRHEKHKPTMRERKEQLQRCEGYVSLKSWHPLRKKAIQTFTINLRW